MFFIEHEEMIRVISCLTCLFCPDMKFQMVTFAYIQLKAELQLFAFLMDIPWLTQTS